MKHCPISTCTCIWSWGSGSLKERGSRVSRCPRYSPQVRCEESRAHKDTQGWRLSQGIGPPIFPHLGAWSRIGAIAVNWITLPLLLKKNYLTNRFHVAVPLFSNRSQMTSKCGKNNEVAHEPQAECVTVVFTTFWRPMWSITEQTHGNMKSISFIQWSEKKKDRHKRLPRTAWLFKDLC